MFHLFRVVNRAEEWRRGIDVAFAKQFSQRVLLPHATLKNEGTVLLPIEALVL